MPALGLVKVQTAFSLPEQLYKNGHLRQHGRGISMLSTPLWWDSYQNQVSMPWKIPLVLNSQQASTDYSANKIEKRKNDGIETSTDPPGVALPDNATRTHWHTVTTN